MKNNLNIDTSGNLELMFSVDDGTNQLIINGDVIPTTSWVGSGNYTYTVNGITYAIVKTNTNTGNLQLIQDSDYTFHFGKLQSRNNEIIDMIYPVGSIYLSVNDVNPSTLFGGTWEKIKDKFLLGAGDTYANGATGGAATVTLTENQIPSHSHSISYAQYQRGSGNLTASALEYSGSSKDTGNTGGGQAHNNMPPYLVVNMWKRVYDVYDPSGTLITSDNYALVDSSGYTLIYYNG